MIDDREGFHVDPAALMLPAYIVPGHGFLVLRDLHCDGLTIDGLDVGDPKAARDPSFRGGFRGYFNVPPGPHTIVARLGERRSEWRVTLAPNAAEVRRVDWALGGLVADDAETEQNYRDLARSGSMLQAGALRPWPLASVFFEGAPERVWIDGRVVPSAVPRGFFGVTGVLPGEHAAQVGDLELTFTLPPASRPLFVCEDGTIHAREPRLAGAMIRVGMMRARAAALVRYDELTPAEHLAGAVSDNLAILEQALAGAGGRSGGFGGEELAALRAAFAGLKDSPSEATVAGYVAALRRCYVIDREMARQAAFFAVWGEEVRRQVEALPGLTRTPAMTYLRYLAEDLQDTGVEALEALGRRLAATLAG